MTDGIVQDEAVRQELQGRDVKRRDRVRPARRRRPARRSSGGDRSDADIIASNAGIGGNAGPQIFGAYDPQAINDAHARGEGGRFA